ncbi:hypothetical protein ENBRE01_1363 [Enteropsectra breve]|nr:hypothetical protein ENBRE01_1363 [Enteropsectra breve]
MNDSAHADLSKQDLDEIPFNKIKPHVHWLILSDNKLTKIPGELTNLKKLSRLAVNDNRVETIESGVGACTGITWMDLTRNKLRDLPDEVGRLTKISGLGLSENSFEKIPDCIYKLRNLRKFGFFSNKITFISPDISKLKNLVKVDLSNNRIESLPDSFCELTNITWLNLSNNNLKTLPKKFGELVLLEELGLGNNHLTEVPDLSNCSRLRILPLFRNKLTAVPKGLTKLKGIEKLDFSDNLIEDFPCELLYNPSLRYLNLRANRMSEICPFEFRKNVLTTVTMLDISENLFTHLPFKLFKAFPETATVRLGYNPFTKRGTYAPVQDSLMHICFTRILHQKGKTDRWIQNIFKSSYVCDECKRVFVTEPFRSYNYSYLDSNHRFVLEKMLCSCNCISKESCKINE